LSKVADPAEQTGAHRSRTGLLCWCVSSRRNSASMTFTDLTNRLHRRKLWIVDCGLGMV